MKHGPLIFLGVFFAMVASWFGLILQPQIQLGAAQPATNLVNQTELHPQPRPGLARAGLEVYRGLGCVSCHSQQIRQTGTRFDVVLVNPGTNLAEVIAALSSAASNIRSAPVRFSTPEAAKLVEATPTNVFSGLPKAEADRAIATLSVGGARADLHIVPLGPDIARGWGPARTVGTDYLYDYPVLPGAQRVGPDLANAGPRRSNPAWLLLKLYDPRLDEPRSVMPPHRFLFERRRIGFYPAPDALILPPEHSPPPNFEIVPTDEARALVAYLLSLRAGAPLFERPLSAVAAVPEPLGQGAFPEGSRTNMILP